MYTIKDYTLYLVLCSENTKGRPILDVASQAIEAGISVLQIREKSLSRQELLRSAKGIRSLCRKSSVPFIVNDDPIAAKRLDADGVHLGQEDVKRYPLPLARDILGRDKMIGISTHSVEQFLVARKQDFDYIAFGPVFTTKTKDYQIGTSGIGQVLADCRQPVIFIGGISLSNIGILTAIGVKNIAVIRAITEAYNIRLRVRRLKQALRAGKPD
ncbi:MAG: thiamine phosphate synthase [Candidatus Omnitrophota bacterium]